jgi:hypothetical protein
MGVDFKHNYSRNLFSVLLSWNVKHSAIKSCNGDLNYACWKELNPHFLLNHNTNYFLEGVHRIASDFVLPPRLAADCKYNCMSNPSGKCACGCGRDMVVEREVRAIKADQKLSSRGYFIIDFCVILPDCLIIFHYYYYYNYFYYYYYYYYYSVERRGDRGKEGASQRRHGGVP